jgi:hypothetical protein
VSTEGTFTSDSYNRPAKETNISCITFFEKRKNVTCGNKQNPVAPLNFHSQFLRAKK